MSSLLLMVTITDRRSTDAFLQLYQQRGVDVNLRTVGSCLLYTSHSPCYLYR